MKKTAFLLIQLTFQFHLAYGFLESFENSPLETCSVEKKSCQIHEDNLMNSLSGIEVEECRQLCFDLDDCKYFSHFGPKNYPIKNYCMLYSSCSILENCEDCYTEDKLCHGSCGRNIESTLEANIIEFKPDVVLEHSCKILCLDHPDCLYYTHYGKDNDHYPNLCVLLSDIQQPFQECDHCITSVPDCENNSYACKFTIDNENTFYDSYLSNSSETNVKFPLASNLACQATFLAIGPGGQGSRYYGGGSGNVEYVVIDISSSEYDVTIGGCAYPYQDHDICVTIPQGEAIIYVDQGETSSSHGGSGYSGGGGNSSKGGSNGSDGAGENGGSGSGMDISEISLEYFVLSPGDGGEPDGSDGGGGGGIIVDNYSPDSWEGKGFGGGGTGPYGDKYYGLPGTVLLEIKPK